MYRDELAAALARADAAERELAATKARAVIPKAPRVKRISGPPGAFRRWLIEHSPPLVVGGILVSAFTFFSLMAHTVSSHRDDWSCYPVPERCAIGKILCSGKFVIVGVRPWHDDTVLDDFGKFDSVAAARATMQAHGCPEVKQ